MNNTQLAPAVEDGQPDPLNSYHEIVRRAFDLLLSGVFDDKPGSSFYYDLSEMQKAEFRRTAYEALHQYEVDFNEDDRIGNSPFYSLHSRLFDYVYDFVPNLEA